MFEKVNPMHPDKIADRIAGALVDLAYKEEENPKIAVEVMIGHGTCHIIAETSVHIQHRQVFDAVRRISKVKGIYTDYHEVAQDKELARNQDGTIRCGDNGIFKGVKLAGEEILLTQYAGIIYKKYGTDGKYIISQDGLIICQSCADEEDLRELVNPGGNLIRAINPLGRWTGGPGVDTGATNRKLGSDMGRAVTGGGLHGKDLSKADVSLNIYAFLKAQKEGEKLICCAIGDEVVDGRAYTDIVEEARDYIKKIGGFEKFAEWGLIRPTTE